MADDDPKTPDGLKQKRLLEHERFVRDRIKKRKRAIRKIEKRLANAWKHLRILPKGERERCREKVREVYDRIDDVETADLPEDIDPSDLYASIGPPLDDEMPWEKEES